MKTVAIDRYLRADRLPHIWCSGCGLGIATRAFVHAVAELGLPQDRLAVVGGIGCSARVGGYLNVDAFHTTHGRAIPFATGLKLANPALKVVVFSGDGDLFTIGGNHFIHAARRNMDLTVVCVNNFIYGMTGGQAGCTTPFRALTSTTPYGNVEQPFNLVHLAMACGAVYVARWTVFHIQPLIRSLREALAKPGFSFVEIVSPCPTVFGRRNGFPTGLDAMKYFKQNSERLREGDGLGAAASAEIALGGKFKVGKFADLERPTFLELAHPQEAEQAEGPVEES